MDECTREVCTQVLERLKKKVTETPVLWNGTAISYTFSAGVSDFGDFETIDSLDVDEMIRIADSRLYQAKKEGRNRIIDR
jgi:diguanylate cyclase (GGDEF)-like protein